MSIAGRQTVIQNQIPLGIILIGLTPAVLILLPWDFGPDSTDFRAFMRVSKLPTTAVEFLFVLLAMLRGFSPVAALLALPRFAKLGLAMLTLSAVWTTLFVAVVPVAAILGLLKFFAHLMFGLAMVHELRRWTSEQRELIWPAIGLGVVTFCLLWGVNILVYHPVGNDWVRLVPSLTTMRSAGPYALASFCAGIAMLNVAADNRNGRLRLAIGVFFGALGLAIACWTGTRAAVVAIFIAAILSLLIVPIRRTLIVMILASAVIGMGVAAALPKVHPSYGIGRMFKESTEPAVETGVSSGRVNIWIEMVDKVMQRPITGWGIDQFRYSFPNAAKSVRHPHNGVMQLIFSTGLWGVLATIMIAISFGRNITREFKRPYQLASFAFMIGALSYSLYDGILYFTYPIMILLIAGSCLLVATPQSIATDK